MTNDPNTQYKPGDIANGHKLTVAPDGTQTWVPVPPKKKSPIRRGLIGVGVMIAALILLVVIIGSANRGARTVDDTAADTSNSAWDAEQAEGEPQSKPEAAPLVNVPVGLVGMTANDAANALTAVGLKAVYDGEPTAKVLSYAPPVEKTTVGSTITLVVEQPPQLSLGQKNAMASGRQYIAMMGFSRSGLIEQLEYEGYSVEDATFAADNIGADWGAEAADSARQYMNTMAFSREGLYEQLIYEGFTDAEANNGLAAVGY